jgi:hypothetical protein
VNVLGCENNGAVDRVAFALRLAGLPWLHYARRLSLRGAAYQPVYVCDHLGQGLISCIGPRGWYDLS